MSLDRLGHYRKKVYGPRNQSSLVLQSSRRPIRQKTEGTETKPVTNKTSQDPSNDPKAGAKQSPLHTNFEGTFFTSTKPKRLLDFCVHPEWLSERIIRPRFSVDSFLQPPQPKPRDVNSAKESSSASPYKKRNLFLQSTQTLMPIQRSSSAPPYLKTAKNPVTWQDWWG